MKLSALVLAGTRDSEYDEVAQAAGVSCKAFAHIDNTPMIERVINTLTGNSSIHNIIVSLPKNISIETESPNLNKKIENKEIGRIDSDISPVRSILKFIKSSKNDETLLVTTADHALLSANILDNFITQYDSKKYDAAVAVLPLDILVKKYPLLNRTRLNFSDGAFKGCNLFLFKNEQSAEIILKFWQKIEMHRKRPLKMIWALGPFLLLRYAIGQLSLQNALAALGQKTGLKLQAIMLTQPEAAIDVDSRTDLDFVRSIATSQPPS